MVRNEPLTAIIPVRGGSKGVPRKNLYEIEGESLLERTIKYARSSDRVDRVLVTTDDPEMFEVALGYDVAGAGLRPAHLATDDASTIDVVRHVVETEGIAEGYLLLLQVTSPLRTIEDLSRLCSAFEQSDPSAEGIVSLVRHLSAHPDKIQRIEEGFVTSYLGKESMVSRQFLPEVYALNGAFYLTHREVVLSQRTLMPRRVLPFVMPAERSLNLDSPLDFVLLEALLERGCVSLERYD